MQILILFQQKKSAYESFTLLTKDSIGKLDAKVVNEFKLKLKSLYPHASVFKSSEERDEEVKSCVQNLSIVAAAEVTEKLGAITLSENKAWTPIIKLNRSDF